MIHVRPHCVSLYLVGGDVQLVPQHFNESVQLGDRLLPCAATFLDDFIALHLHDKNIVPPLVGEKAALVDLSDDALDAPDHSDAVEAEDLESRNVLNTFLKGFNHLLLSLLSKLSAGITAELKGRPN